MTNNNKKIIKMLYIHYLIWFQEEQIKFLFNSSSKINIISPGYTKKLGFKVW